MRIKKLLLPLLFICTLFAIVFRVFAKSDTINSMPQSNAYDEIDTYIEEQIQRLNIPGASLAIVEGDQIIHMRGFGQAYPDGATPSPQTPFFIGSLTKSFTALAVMQLVEAEKIDLDAPVQQYLPWFQVADAQASTQITVRHLLNQTSGLSESSGRVPLADFDNSPDATERQARALKTVELNHPVGSTCEYSNSNYNLLGLIIEAVSGESYEGYIQKHIFTPLMMNQSYTSKKTAEQNGLAVGHQFWFARPVATLNMSVPHGSLPSGQLISSAEDMAHYLIAQLNGGRYNNTQILSLASVNEMHQGVAEYVQMGLSFGKYGMGWFVDDSHETKIDWHTGIVPNYFAYMALLPEHDKGVILLLNGYHYLMTPALTETGAGVAAIMAGEEPESSQATMMPWIMRGQVLIPILQIIGVIITLGLLRRWQLDPLSHPNKKRMWGLFILPSLIINLLLALLLLPVLGPVRGFWHLFMPDFSTLALLCGSFAGTWAFLRTGLILRVLRKPT